MQPYFSPPLDWGNHTLCRCATHRLCKDESERVAHGMRHRRDRCDRIDREPTQEIPEYVLAPLRAQCRAIAGM